MKLDYVQKVMICFEKYVIVRIFQLQLYRFIVVYYGFIKKYFKSHISDTFSVYNEPQLVKYMVINMEEIKYAE